MPLLWRSELRSILAGYLRDGTFDAEQIAQVMAAAEAILADREHLVSSERVFAIVGKSNLSAYDAEFVALAGVLDVPLVTADKAVLKAFPDRARTMEAFAAGCFAAALTPHDSETRTRPATRSGWPSLT